MNIHLAVAAPIRSIKDFLELHEVALLLVQFRPDVAAPMIIGIFFYGLAEEPAHGLLCWRPLSRWRREHW